MRKLTSLVFLVILVLFVNSISSAQPSWIFNPVRTDINFHVPAPTPDATWVYYATTPSGGGEKINSNGTYITIPVPEYMLQFYFENATTGYACHTNQAGTQMYFKKTVNGGMTWNAVSGPMSNIVTYPVQLTKINGWYYVAGLGGLKKSTDLISWIGDPNLIGDVTGITAADDGIYISLWQENSMRLMFQQYNEPAWQTLVTLNEATTRLEKNIYTATLFSNGKKVIFFAAGNNLYRYREDTQETTVKSFVNRIGFMRVGNFETVYFTYEDYSHCHLLQTKVGGETNEIGSFNQMCTGLEILGNGLLISIASPGRATSTVYYGTIVTGIPGQNTTPKDFSLSQNYPNPFNPTTSINYSLPRNSSVILRVFDVSGKEVATLVNEKKQAGSYSINFDASNLSSGVYFYKLTAGDFTNTKTMMLIK